VASGDVRLRAAFRDITDIKCALMRDVSAHKVAMLGAGSRNRALINSLVTLAR
jgi:hypothetical protein